MAPAVSLRHLAMYIQNGGGGSEYDQEKPQSNTADLEEDPHTSTETRHQEDN